MICTTGFDHRGSWCFQDIGLNLKDGLQAARRASEIQLLGNPSSGEPNARRKMAVLDWLCNLSGPCALTARYEKPPGRGPERPEISRGLAQQRVVFRIVCAVGRLYLVVLATGYNPL
jgi:hypothetical protein